MTPSDQYRVCFIWTESGPEEVEIVDRAAGVHDRRRQMEAVARRVPQAEYSADIVAAIDALTPPMPPYSVFKIEPRRFFLPEIRDGVNIRTEVLMGRD